MERHAIRGLRSVLPRYPTVPWKRHRPERRGLWRVQLRRETEAQDSPVTLPGVPGLRSAPGLPTTPPPGPPAFGLRAATRPAALSGPQSSRAPCSGAPCGTPQATPSSCNSPPALAETHGGPDVTAKTGLCFHQESFSFPFSCPLFVHFLPCLQGGLRSGVDDRLPGRGRAQLPSEGRCPRSGAARRRAGPVSLVHTYQEFRA